MIKSDSIQLRKYARVIVFLLCSVAMGIMGFFISVQKSVDINSGKRLLINLSRQSEHLNDILNVHFQFLDSIAMKLAESDDLLSDDNFDMISYVVDSTNFNRVAIIDGDGNSYYSDGATSNVAARKYFQDAMKGNSSVSYPILSKIDGETKVILAVPIYKDDVIIGVLGGSYDIYNLSHMLFEDMFNGIGYSIIVNKEGNIVTYDGNEQYRGITISNNFFDYFENSTFRGNDTIETVKTAFENKSSGVVKLGIDDDRKNDRYLAYTPLGTDNWMICYIVPIATAQQDYTFIGVYEAYLFVFCAIMVGLSVLQLLYINMKRQRELIRSASIDELTNIYNKSTAEHSIDRYLKTTYTISGVQAFLMFDVDCFKSVNDTYGHTTGDRVLAAIGASLLSVFRDSDIKGRIGGDEFCVLMKNVASKEIAERKAKQLIESIQQIKIDEFPDLSVSISVGIAYAPNNGKSYIELSKCADKALYETKKNGKNGYTVYNG